MLKEIKTKKLLQTRILALKNAIIGSRVYLPSDVSKFIFLCGANKSKDEISERRKALIQFSKKHLPHTQFFLAEKMFATLKEEGHRGNILDVEHLISDFSDYILIVLESASAFTELGAFSHDKLRDKLVVINDIKYKNEESFINLGPVKAIEESAGLDRIVHYKMNPNGVQTLDSIGDTYQQIFELFKEPLNTKASPALLDSLNPSKKFDKNTAMFLHDLIYLSGPILYKEVIEVLILIFGRHSFNKTAHILAILSSFESIERNNIGLYRSRRDATYFDYRFDISKLISTFRNYTLRKYPARIYAY